MVYLDGRVIRREIATFGDDWEWLAGITPLLELEGESARTFLEWVAREQGLQLAFTDEAVARSADETILGGTSRHLTLDNALDAVLPTCRMGYQVKNGILIISATP